ncbi:unnamed protein product [Chironomus riparius]|uniref:Putative ionotropic receptor ligand binding domain-containing protein n=1 Tax=Chironomus riparius TaxID=315576 RepID=A0A9N9S7K5_9DIPT|nr:unnamed protein product [Chironomus riparius]
MRSVLLLIPVVLAIYRLNINDAGAVSTTGRDIEYEWSIKEAILMIFRDYFCESTVVVNFVTSFGEIEAKFVADQLVGDLIGDIEGNFSIIIETVEDIKEHWRRKKEFCVFFVDSHASFERIFAKVTDELFRFTGYYVIIFINPDSIHESEIQKIFENLWTKDITNAVVLCPENHDAHIHTYFPFTRSYCEQVHQVLWNIYRTSVGLLYSDRQIFPDKLTNFYGCEFTVVTYENPPFMTEIVSVKNNIFPWGFDGILIWGLEKSLNFTTKRIYLHKKSWKNHTNEYLTGKALRMVVNGIANFSIGFLVTTTNRNFFMTPSYSYYTTNLVWAIPSGEKLTAFQMFTKPFQNAIWGLVMTTMGISVAVIRIVARRSQKVKNFIFGYKVKYPILNMFNILFGGSMPRLPSRNFARFLLALFILYAIVIRNAYQGALYHFIRMEEQPQDVKDMKDMMNRNFKLYTLDAIKIYLQPFEFIYNHTIPLTVHEFEDFWKNLSTGNNIAVLTSEDHVAYWNKIGYPNSFVSFLPEKQTAVNLVMYFQKTSCLTDAINKKIFEMNDNGLMDVFRIQTIDKSYLKRKTVIREPQQLRLRQIEGGNMLLQLGLIISGFVFVGEVIWGRILEKENGKCLGGSDFGGTGGVLGLGIGFFKFED